MIRAFCDKIYKVSSILVQQCTYFIKLLRSQKPKRKLFQLCVCVFFFFFFFCFFFFLFVCFFFFFLFFFLFLFFCIIKISRFIYKPVREKKVSDQFRQRPSCTSTENGYRLAILDLESI